MDPVLPVWAQPHPFLLLDEGQPGVFTFGLALTHVHHLSTAEGVHFVGRRFGYEWLPGLSAGVQRETGRELALSDLEVFLREEHGILGPNHYSDLVVDYDAVMEPPDAVAESFAKSDGALIRRWAQKALGMFAINLSEWARARERVPRSYAELAQRRLKQTKMGHTLTRVNALDGSQHWARGYACLYERIALEYEDLALRRPPLRTCPLCQSVYVPLRAGQSLCGGQIWGEGAHRLVRRCTPPSEEERYGAVASALHRKRRRTLWARMNRALHKYGHGDPRTLSATREFEAWKRQNASPLGRPPKSTPERAPVFAPVGQAVRGKSRSKASTA